MSMIVTNLNKIDLARARNQEIEMPEVTHIAVGTGGMDGESPRVPVASETALVTETIRKLATHVSRTDNKNKWQIQLSASEGNGQAISEIGLFNNSTLLAVETFLPKNKDENSVFTFEIEEEF